MIFLQSFALILFAWIYGLGPGVMGFGVGEKRAHNKDTCVVLADPEPPPYYQIELVTTKKVPGAGLATGVGEVTYKSTPFGISIGEDGSYQYDLDIRVERLAPARKGQYEVWVTTPDIQKIKHLGPLDENHQIKGQVSWNKFLIVISLEDEPAATKWRGPIVLRGLSRSGYMHTMAGHGPYESEPCAVYGY